MLDTTPADGQHVTPRIEVADLDRALSFYCDLLGLRLRARRSGVAALQAPDGGGRIALRLRRGSRRRAGHAALVCPDRPTLARTLARVVAAGVPIEGSADHGVGEAVYLRDPDGNGVELHRDRPESEWPTAAAPALNRPLDLPGLLAGA